MSGKIISDRIDQPRSTRNLPKSEAYPDKVSFSLYLLMITLVLPTLWRRNVLQMYQTHHSLAQESIQVP
jgi:hypothetical protein